MIHRISAGYFDPAAIKSSRSLVVTKPIDVKVVDRLVNEFALATDGEIYKIGDDIMIARGGYFDLPWLSPHVNHQAVEFMLRLHRETKCMFVDLSHGEIVGVDVLQQSIGLIPPRS